ncbi:MAG: hypothetical protein ACYCSW_05415 [bacterium]
MKKIKIIILGGLLITMISMTSGCASFMGGLAGGAVGGYAGTKLAQQP